MVNKLDIGADLAFNRSRSDVTVQTAVATPLFPSANTAMDSLKVFATYKLQDKLSVTGSFWYERYEAQDWRLDGVLPATVQNLLAFGQQAPRYKVGVVQVAMRYRF